MSTSSPYRVPASRDELRIFALVPRPRATAIIARLLKVILALTIVALVFVPWQQNTHGEGRVIAYAPVERQQAIEAPVDGRLMKWHVQEGDHVEEGDAIADVADNDPDILTRLRAERDAQVARIEAAKIRASSVGGRVDSLGDSRTAALKAAEARVKMAHDRTIAAEHAKDATDQAVATARLNLDRQRALLEQGLASKRTMELAELEFVRTRTDLDRARAALSAARSEELALAADVAKVSGDTQASIDDARATRASADSEIASASAELARIEVRLSRQSSQAVKAPRAGAILRIVAKQGGEMVKAGDTLAVIVPDTQDRAVELWVSGNDVPLVTPGRRVRLQFEGWPAVQFTGWPELAAGTFGGRVAFVDAAVDGSGRFRAVVIPDGDEKWPASRFLRQGARVSGWILLDRVRLGYEMWRQFNGFPPKLPTGEVFVEAPAHDPKDKGKK
jgi:membrane fusion protein, adhesin transport system